MYRSRHDSIVNSILVMGAVGVIAVLVGGFYYNYFQTEGYVEVTVNKTERVSYGSGGSIQHKYLVYTDQDTYQCTDSLLFGKFDSSNIYGSLQSGQRYRLHVVGWRWHFGSWYKNILGANRI